MKARANPHGKYKEDPWEKDDIRRRGNVPQVKSRYKEKFASCGPEGDAMGYEHDPVSAFQARCRRRAARELQHFTRCLKDEIVERTCNISLGPNANHHGTFFNLVNNKILIHLCSKIGKTVQLFGTIKQWIRAPQADECYTRTVCRS